MAVGDGSSSVGLVSKTTSLLSFDNCLSESVKKQISLQPKTTIMGVPKHGGYLWDTRSCFLMDDIDLNDSSVTGYENYCDENIPLSPLSQSVESDMCDYEEYNSEAPREVQDMITKSMNALVISERRIENSQEMSLESELDPTVWTFLRLLSHKLDERTVPNMFDKQETPTCNLLVDMLSNHRLRTMFDFEKAVEREFNLSNKTRVRVNNSDASETVKDFAWNFRTLDKVAGHGTAVSTVFGLKESGVFRGAKRRLTFTQMPMSPKKKVAKVEHLSNLLESLNVGNNRLIANEEKKVVRCNVKVKVTKSQGGWLGNMKSPPSGSVKVAKSPAKGSQLYSGPSPRRRYINTASGKNFKAQSGSKVSSPVTPRNSVRSNAGTPKRGQCSIRDFIECSPRARPVGRASNGSGEGRS